MSRDLMASFYLRLYYQNEANASDCNGDTEGLITSARSLAESWIDGGWYREDGTDQRTSSLPLLLSEALVKCLEEFWHLVVLAAKHTFFDAPQMQSIIDLLNEKKNDVANLKRYISLDGKLVQGSPIDSDRVEPAHTTDGTVWADLPYFKSSLFDAFLRAPPLTPPEQWTNLHAFAARATAAGVRDLSFYAVWAMYDALEVTELYPVPKPGQPSIPSADRFYPVLVWFQYCYPFILQACQAKSVPPNQCHDEYSCRWHRGGPEFVGILALEAGVKRSGFSMERYAGLALLC